MNIQVQNPLQSAIEQILSNCDRILNPPKKRDPEAERLIMATAKALVLVDDRAHINQVSVLPFWGEKDRWQIAESLLRRGGGKRAAVDSIRRGKIDIADELGDFTGDLLHGLKLSDLIRQRSDPNSSYHRIKEHRAFRNDLDATLFPHRFIRYLSGSLYLCRCPLLLLPPETGKGVHVMSGLFAGARITEVEGEEWLELPDTAEIRSLLDEWIIPFESDHGKLRVSPFFGALSSVHMPDTLAAEILRLKRPAQCPFLPVLYYHLLLSAPYRQFITHSNALPFGCGRATFFRRGWKRRDLHMTGVRMGTVGVRDEVRELVRKWYQGFVRCPKGSLKEIRAEIRGRRPAQNP